MAKSTDTFGGLDQYIEQALIDRKIPGAAVVVVHDDAIVYMKGHGVKEVGARAAIDEHTLFQIGSTTKAFTAAALAILVDEGRVRWDEPIITYLPAFELHDPWLTRNVTVRDAVAHRSGVVGGGWDAVLATEADDVLRGLRYGTAFTSFRNSYNYNNAMYAVAGKIVEAASGTPWSDFVKTRLFLPLGMNRSGTSPFEFWDKKDVAATYLGTAPAGRVSRKSARDPNVAMPHALQDEHVSAIPWQSYDNMAAAGAIISNIADLSNWLRFQLHAGEFEGQEVLKSATLLELHSPQNLHAKSENPFEEGPSSYAMGWHRDMFNGEVCIHHGGGMWGFPAYVSVLEDRKVGVAVLANGLAPDLTTLYDFNRSISLWIFDRFQENPFHDWNATYLRKGREELQRSKIIEAELQKSRLPGTEPSRPLNEYANDYEDKSGQLGKVTVDIDHDRLRLSFPGEGAFSAFLDHWHHDIFRLQPNGVRSMQGFVHFVLGPDGNVTSMFIRDFGAQFAPFRASTSINHG